MAPSYVELHMHIHNTIVNMEFDPDKAEENLCKHGVSFAHAEQLLRDPGGVTIEEPDSHEEPRFVNLGMDSLGRVLVVVHTPRDERTRIISARKASRSEAMQGAQGI